MASNRRMSRMLDEHRFDALAASVAPETSNVGVMLLDRDLRIRGANRPAHRSRYHDNGGGRPGRLVWLRYRSSQPQP